MADKPSVQEQEAVKLVFVLFGLGGIAAIIYLASKVAGGIIDGDFDAIVLNIFFMFPAVTLTIFALAMGFVKKIEYPEEENSA